MITIKIFLASSLTEFSSQRKELEAFVNSLNNIYVEKGSNARRCDRSREKRKMAGLKSPSGL